jgi:hypothetical protein
MGGSRQYTASFSSAYQVQPRFVDQSGTDVSGQVTRATVRSDTGDVMNIPSAGSVWLPETRIVSKSNKLSVVNVRYTWQSVIVSGTSVLDSGRQSFVPAKSPMITATGRFHDLTINGYDAMFGNGTGTRASVTYPDGSVHAAPLDSNHQLVLKHLPRGTYMVRIEAGAAVVASHQVRLSRSTALSVQVISFADLSILLVTGIVVVCLILSIRRHKFRSRMLALFRMRRRRAAAG